MKALIGVSTSARGGWRSFLAIRFALWRAGGKAVRITPDRPVDLDRLDGLVAGAGMTSVQRFMAANWCRTFASTRNAMHLKWS